MFGIIVKNINKLEKNLIGDFSQWNSLAIYGGNRYWNNLDRQQKFMQHRIIYLFKKFIEDE